MGQVGHMNFDHIFQLWCIITSYFFTIINGQLNRQHFTTCRMQTHHHKLDVEPIALVLSSVMIKVD